ncbi:MAG: heavy metal translocating P-type ATPase [Chloroflexota bacterium]
MFFEITAIIGGAILVGRRVYQDQRVNKSTLVNALTKHITTVHTPTPTNSWVSELQAQLTTLTGHKRRQQMATIAGSTAPSVEERAVLRLLRIQWLNIGIAGLSLLYSPLILLTLPGSIYSLIPAYRLTYQSFKERRISSYVLDTILATGAILGGYLYTNVAGLWMFTLGQYLLVKSQNNSRQSLTNLFGELPRTVWVVVDDQEVEIPFDQLQFQDLIIVTAGQMIPVDGLITSGVASVDQHMLTGEAQPVEKCMGDTVFASTVVLAGQIHIQTQKTGQETVAMQIGKVLEQTADFQSTLQSRGEKIADQLTLPTLGLSALALPTLGLSSALAILTNMFGYKMRIYSPLSMLSFLNIASQQGILIKDGRSLEVLDQIDMIVFDKTGTLTIETPTVAVIHTFNGVTENELLQYAATAEHGQVHPIAKAILQCASERDLSWPRMESANYRIGYGIQVTLADDIIHVGSHQFMTLEDIAIDADLADIQKQCHKQGHSLVMVAHNRTLVGAIELHATIRPEAKQIVDELRHRGLPMCIISGDHEHPTNALANTLGIEQYFASTLPEQKAEIIEDLQQGGRTVCFIGDGINDSIALKKADLSISLRGATTVAQDTAQVVMMDGTLGQFMSLLEIGKHFEKNMQTNLSISTIPSAICIGGVLFLHWGVTIGVLLSGTILFVGMGNGLLPLFTYKEIEASKPSQRKC